MVYLRLVGLLSPSIPFTHMISFSSSVIISALFLRFPFPISLDSIPFPFNTYLHSVNPSFLVILNLYSAWSSVPLNIVSPFLFNLCKELKIKCCNILSSSVAKVSAGEMLMRFSFSFCQSANLFAHLLLDFSVLYKK